MRSLLITPIKIGTSTSEIVMFINSAIILAAAYTFGIEVGMYSI